MSAGYTIKFVPQSISLSSGFSSATWSMKALSADTDDIVAQSDVTPEEASGVTGVKQIADFLMQIEKCKSVICFSLMPPESSSGSTQAQNQHPSHS